MNAPEKDGIPSEPGTSRRQRDDTRRPVWLEATESFYRKLTIALRKNANCRATMRSARVWTRCFGKDKCKPLP